MDFKTFFTLLKNRISDGMDVPEFMRYLISIITELSEEDWNAPKDPGNQVKSNTLRNYSKQGISQKLAKSIVYRLNKENFIEEISSKPQNLLELLADDFLPYASTANSANISEILANIFIDIIRTTAGMTASDKLEEQKQLQSSLDLKNKYGKYLLKECEYHCPMPGCTNLLYVTDGKSETEVYEVSQIEKDKDPTITNLIALCPRCFATYQLDSNKKTCSSLKQVKKVLSIHMENIIELSPMELELGLTEVITKIEKLNQKDLVNFTMDPKEINEKINPHDNFILYNQIYSSVMTYFLKINELMKNLDKQQKIDYENIQYQMRVAYKKLRAKNKNNTEIFNALSEKLHKITLKDILYCQLIVCYFVQSCEVFDAITK